MNRENLESLDEESLFRIQNTISEIIKERNFKKGDIEAIVDSSFDIAFPKNDSLGLNPWVEGSMLICPGARIDKTQTKHICKFVVVEEDWSWESGHMVNDVIRRDQSSKRFKQQSITLISPFEFNPKLSFFGKAISKELSTIASMSPFLKFLSLIISEMVF